MGVDGGEYSLCRKRSVGFGGHVCRAGFLCETARGDFRVRDAIKNGTGQSRAPLRAVAGTRAPAERPVSLDFASCIISRSRHAVAFSEGGYDEWADDAVATALWAVDDRLIGP